MEQHVIYVVTTTCDVTVDNCKIYFFSVINNCKIYFQNNFLLIFNLFPQG